MNETQTRRELSPSEEATARGLELARAQGAAMTDTVRHMIDRIAKGGGEQSIGDYLVAYAYEDPEGLYRWRNGSLEWEEPGDANVHLEIVVRDIADGRFVYGAGVRVAIEDSDGRGVGSHELPFLWHPSLPHYGANIRVPRSGTYALRVRVDPPTYARHDRLNGRRFITPTEVTFRQVRLDTADRGS